VTLAAVALAAAKLVAGEAPAATSAAAATAAAARRQRPRRRRRQRFQTENNAPIVLIFQSLEAHVKESVSKEKKRKRSIFIYRTAQELQHSESGSDFQRWQIWNER
jgi:hypothetical protein